MDVSDEAGSGLAGITAVSRHRKAKSSKRSRSKGNSLPPAKRFDFTMVDDDFEELQRSFALKKLIQTRRNT